MLERAFDLLIHHPQTDAGEALVARLQGSPFISGIALLKPGDVASLHQRPDILIVRPELPLAEGNGSLAALHEGLGHPELVALLDAEEVAAVPQLYQAGFSAYLSPNSEPEAFEAAFRVARQGGIYLSKGIAAALLLSSGDSRNRSLVAIGLTVREKQILRLIAVNMSNKDIARKLDLSVRTVETHRLNIRKKTNAGNWRELSAIAERLGLLADYDFRAGLAERVTAPGFHED